MLYEKAVIQAFTYLKDMPYMEIPFAPAEPPKPKFGTISGKGMKKGRGRTRNRFKRSKRK